MSCQISPVDTMNSEYFEFFTVTFLTLYSLVLCQNYQNNLEEDERILRLSSSKPWDIIKTFGYPVENFNVTTEDGYILSVQRIPHGKNNMISTKPPILLITGLFFNSVTWILDENSMAYELADLGYDVWLINNRGSIFNREHKYLDPNSNKYWNFSFHEMGVYDLPNTIDYILEKTKYKSLYCIGYSQGGQALAVMLSKLPKYNDKVRLAIFFGPAVYVKHTFHIFQLMANTMFYKHAKALITKYGHNIMLDHQGLFQVLFGYEICKDNIGAKFCAALAMYFFGPNYANLNWKTLPIIFSHFPSGASFKQLLHSGQLMRTGDFAEYASAELFSPNYKPKLYNISAISAPTVVFYGQNDWQVPPQDVLRFADQLPNLVMKHLAKDQFFNHIDFVFGLNKYEMIEKYVFALLKKY